MVGCIFILFGEAGVLRFLSKTEIIGCLSRDDSTDDYCWEENELYNLDMMAKTFEYKLRQILSASR
jgi:hypothetical protein